MKLLRALLAAVGIKKGKTQEPAGSSTKGTSGRFMCERPECHIMYPHTQHVSVTCGQCGESHTGIGLNAKCQVTLDTEGYW